VHSLRLSADYFFLHTVMPTFSQRFHECDFALSRYADVIVHRLLAVCVGADATYPELLDKRKSQDLSNNLNYRNRMAQYAGRASVNLHTHVSFNPIVYSERFVTRSREPETRDASALHPINQRCWFHTSHESPRETAVASFPVRLFYAVS